MFGEDRSYPGLSSPPHPTPTPRMGPPSIALAGHAPPFLTPSAPSGNYPALLNHLALTRQPVLRQQRPRTLLRLTNSSAFPQYCLCPRWEPGPPQLSSTPPRSENHPPTPAPQAAAHAPHPEFLPSKHEFAVTRSESITTHRTSDAVGGIPREGGSPWALALNDTRLW